MKEVCVHFKYGVVCILLALSTIANSNDNNIPHTCQALSFIKAHLIFTIPHKAEINCIFRGEETGGLRI